MKYKVGDKVLVRDWDDMEKEFGLNCRGNIDTGPYSFIISMKEYCNTFVTIKEVTSGGPYRIEEDSNRWFWCDEMFDPNFHFKPVHKQEKSLIPKAVLDFTDYSITNENCCDILDYSFTSMKNVIESLSKEIDKMNKETKPKQQKQKTKKERLKEKIGKYQENSGIESIEVIVPNKVIKIKMDLIHFKWKSEYKMVCDDQDKFSLERAIYLAYAKDECCGKYTPEGIEAYADQISMEKKFVARVKAAMKLYECQEELKELDEEEAAMIKRKKEKRWKQKERKAERKRNEQITLQKEAYVQAWKEIEEIRKKKDEAKEAEEAAYSEKITKKNAETFSVEK